jgi:hypothetical protein
MKAGQKKLTIDLQIEHVEYEDWFEHLFHRIEKLSKSDV